MPRVELGLYQDTLPSTKLKKPHLKPEGCGYAEAASRCRVTGPFGDGAGIAQQ
jgi:hypothetical protein